MVTSHVNKAVSKIRRRSFTPDFCVLSRGHTSDFLVAQVMRFFQILSRRQRGRVATRVTNSSEFDDKLKAA